MPPNELHSTMTAEQRLQRLEDIEAIKVLKYRYASYCDAGYDPDGITSLFVPDGHWIVTGLGGEATGRDEMHEFFSAIKDTIVWAMHFVIAPQVELSADGQSAEGRFGLLSMTTIKREDAPAGFTPTVSTLNYVDKFVKIDGRWYFQELSGTSHFASEWTKGWVEQRWMD